MGKSTKKTISLLMAALLALSVAACGPSKATTETISKIDAIGNVTVDSGDTIEDAEGSYNALRDNEKEQVTNYAVLTDARTSFDAITETISKIDAIGNVTVESGDAVEDAEDSYNALKDNEKEQVTNYTILTDARASFDAITETISKIDAIGNVTVDSGDVIKDAEDSYNALKDNEKTQVTNYTILTDARASFDVLIIEYNNYMVFVTAAEEILASGGTVAISDYIVEGFDIAEYFELSEDGKSVTIDTKTSEHDTWGEYFAFGIVEWFNENIGLPNSILDKMRQTRALDGMQTQTNGKITVTWNYHPDDGLSVVYEYDYSADLTLTWIETRRPMPSS